MGLTADEYVNWFITVLVDYAGRCGLPIKGDETWRSRYLFEYSRAYYYKGSSVSAALKRVSRLSSEANQTPPTMTGDLSSLYSTGSATAAKDTHPGPAFLCTSVEAAYLIRRKMTWLKLEQIECTSACLLTSRYIGGLPIGLYSSFCTRATQDPLTCSLRVIKLAATYPSIKPHLLRWLNLEMAEPDWETLIKDPLCLPLRAPLQPESLVRKAVKEGIPDIVINRLLRELFHTNNEEKKQSLITTPMSIRPVNPRLLNKLYSLSNLSIQEKYLGKYSNTRSIQRLAFKSWANELELLEWMLQLEQTNSLRYEHKKARPEHLARIEGAKCTTLLAHELRLEGWKHHLEGVTMAAQHEQSTLHRWDSVPAEWKERCILIQVDDSMKTLTPLEKGNRQPYFGSQTKLRARRAPLQVLEVGSMISNLKQLIEIKLWLHDSPDLYQLLDTLIKEKTDLSQEVLEKYTRQVYSGTLSHRLDCPGLKKGGLSNQLTTFASHVAIVSDTATKYAKQGINYTICFQSLFLTAISQLSQLAYAGVDITGAWASVVSCTQCVQEIPKETFSLSTTSYSGTPLPIAISELTPKIQPIRMASTKLHSDRSR